MKTIRNYIERAKKLKSWMPPRVEILLQQLGKVDIRLRKSMKLKPSHLDLMIENLIEAGNDIKLIDWEYSANADFRFDLAMFSFKGGLDKSGDELLIKTYYGKNRPELYAELQAMKAVVCFREASWAILQRAISPIQFDYKKYATEHLADFEHYLVGHVV